MQAYSNELWLGVWLLILPFLGFPGSWKERLVALTGLAVIGVALYRQYGAPVLPAEPSAEPSRAAGTPAEAVSSGK